VPSFIVVSGKGKVRLRIRKRPFAVELGVDPYTDWTALQDARKGLETQDWTVKDKIRILSDAKW